MLTKYISYVVRRDYGFAPNPFHDCCTLATCKPRIRKAAQVNDWIFGWTSKELCTEKSLLFCMRVSATLSFNEYWNSSEFFRKRPVMNGSLKMMYGDNIYNHHANAWYQADSHHSYPHGVTNLLNLKRDTSVDRVLVSNEFYYFGKFAIKIPSVLEKRVARYTQGEKYLEEADARRLITYISERYSPGVIGLPFGFGGFERYKG